jgi:hypothetical protein
MRETEVIVSMPIRNPATGGVSHKFTFAGKVDGIEGETIDDWKTTDDPHKFISRRAIQYQAELYTLGLQHVGKRVTSIRYRLITKPGLRFTEPKYSYAVMKAGRKSAVKVFGNQADAEAFAKLRGNTVEERIQGDKDLGVYENRCLKWVREEPDRLFDHTVPVSSGRLQQARHYLWECTKRILDCRLNARWLPNAGACEAYGRECPYLALCECVAANADPTWIIEDKFEVADDTHPELDGKANGDKELLTNSSAGCLCLCEVRYYWRFERKLRKPRTSIDAAWLGSAMHVGLEHFVEGGLEAAYAAIDEWREHNPVLGDDVRKQDQEIGKARAMMRAAAEKWL